MTPLSPVDAMSLLFARPEAELELDGGGLLRVTRMSVDGERAVVTAPRLSVATGMTLTGRVVGPDSRPWEIHLLVEDASYHTPDLAMVRMHPTAIRVDESRRAAERVPIGGVAWLEAVNCQDVVDGDRVEGTLEDLSRTGVAFTTARLLRVGDRLIFHGRFFADSISGEVRVASVRPSSAPGHTIVGARFLELDRESVARVDRILSGGREPVPESPGGLSLAALRELAANAPVEDDDVDEAGGGWLSRIRRDR
ncbi:MAG TPA: PilZ domain-containing protein [Gaiellales bacterium]|nr:PilZ domain-containing protein [Gaiellales bacterium]